MTSTSKPTQRSQVLISTLSDCCLRHSANLPSLIFWSRYCSTLTYLLYTYIYMSVCIYIYYVTKSLCVFSFFNTPIFIVLCLIIWFQTWCPYISLGYEEFRESADPAVVTLSSGRGGHEDLPHLVRVSGSARLQELHPPHHPFGHGHSAPGHQPQQSLRYHT